MSVVTSAVKAAVSLLVQCSYRLQRTYPTTLQTLTETADRLAVLYHGQGVSTAERMMLHRLWLQCKAEIERLEHE